MTRTTRRRSDQLLVGGGDGAPRVAQRGLQLGDAALHVQRCGVVCGGGEGAVGRGSGVIEGGERGFAFLFNLADVLLCAI